MHADIAGAVRVVEAAKAFRWTWKDEDIARFCDAVGWRIQDRRRTGATLATDLQLDEPLAFLTGSCALLLGDAPEMAWM